MVCTKCFLNNKNSYGIVFIVNIVYRQCQKNYIKHIDRMCFGLLFISVWMMIHPCPAADSSCQRIINHPQDYDSSPKFCFKLSTACFILKTRKVLRFILYVKRISIHPCLLSTIRQMNRMVILLYKFKTLKENVILKKLIIQ